MNEPEEARLLEAARAGDAAALEALLAHYQPRIYRFGMKMCGDAEDAKDVLQETMLAVIRNLRDDRLLDREKLPAYICGTARNPINNHLRTRSRKPESGPPPEGLPAPDLQVEVGGRGMT